MFYFIKILTKNEMDDPEHKVLDEIFGITNQLPADGNILKLTNFYFLDIQLIDTTYEKLLALFVGSYFVNTLEVMPKVKDADFLNTRDNLGEYYHEIRN